MTRGLLKILFLAVLVAAGSLAVNRYLSHTAEDEELAEKRLQNRQLLEAVDRLTAERRVAQLLVTDRTVGRDGVPRTTVLMEEYARDGSALPPARFTLVGTEAHLDATVIRFDHGLVESNDPMRGHSMALFTRIYGDHQPPADGAVVDGPARIGQLDRGLDPRVSAFERDLWAQFWHLADDPAYRRRQGVRAAAGQGVWFPCDPDRLYTVTLEADGGLSLNSEPLPGIYRDALHGPEHPGR